MIKNDKKNINFITIGLYSLSAITALYTLLTIYNSHTYISGLVKKQGLIISEQLISVISYYMNASTPYVFYTVTTLGLGYIIHKLDNLKIHEEVTNNETIEKEVNLEDDEKDLDNFIETLKK